MKKLVGIIAAILLVILDQVTKTLAKNKLEFNEPITIIPRVFKLQYLENTGAAFGMFKDKLLFFILLTLIVLIAIVYVYIKIPESKKYVPMKFVLVFITAGAIGNLIDRIIHNYVIDFLYFELIDFPIFNLADCYVTISAVLLLFLFIFIYKDEDFSFVSISKREKLDKD